MSRSNSRQQTPPTPPRKLDEDTLFNYGITYDATVYRSPCLGVDAEARSDGESDGTTDEDSDDELPDHIEEFRQQILDFEGIVPREPSVSKFYSPRTYDIA